MDRYLCGILVGAKDLILKLTVVLIFMLNE